MIFHISTGFDWATAQVTGTLTPPSLELEGFVHCSNEHQLAGVLDRFYPSRDGILILGIDEGLLATHAPNSELRWEAPAHPDGSTNTTAEQSQKYPHIYGPLPVTAVVDVKPAE